MNNWYRGLAVATALVFGGFGTPAFSQTAKSSEQLANTYPPVVVEGFMEGCVGEQGSEMEPLCTCAIEQFQNNYTLEEFIGFVSKMGDGEEMPEELTPVVNQIFSACAAYYPSDAEHATR